ncbi:hypothetical protein MPSEU_000374000 [Mayamaea pseudoterrestris]|nr:hypothetical protein MPSEU_000374000 [Mayamaea pseudoterrestris]
MSDKPKEMKISLDNDEYEVEETTRRAAAPRIESVQAFSSYAIGTKQPLMQTQPQKEFAIAPSQIMVWHLTSVPQLPEFHHLEQTAVFVNHASPSDLSKRISEILRSRSIEATYEDSKAKVKCLTSDGVDFRIRLYRGRKSYSTGIIVEVQRRFGTSANFYQDTTAIFDAVQNKTSTFLPPSSEVMAVPEVSDTEEDDFEVDGKAALKFVTKLLDAGLDSQYLAFQTLASLTNASKMGDKTSRAVSYELLRTGNVVGGKLLDHVMATKTDDIYHLRTMAMTILANVVVAVNGDVGQGLYEQIRPVLLQELNAANKNARMAQLSCLVVEQLLAQDHDVAEFHMALEKALEAGMARHAGLERQAKLCLDKLQAL